MKKRMASVLLLLLLGAHMSGFALAEGEQVPSGLVTDRAGLLTAEEQETLSRRAAEITEDYGCAVYILTVDDIGSESPRAYAKNVYRDNELGYGDARSGILFMVSIESRDYVTITYGAGTTAFTDGDIKQIEQALLPDLSGGAYFESFSTYLEECRWHLAYGKGAGGETNPEGHALTAIEVGGSVAIALVVASVVCLVLLRQMKTAVPKGEADTYIPKNGFHVTASEDLFLYAAVTRTKRETERQNTGGSSVDADGFGGSQGGKF